MCILCRVNISKHKIPRTHLAPYFLIKDQKILRLTPSHFHILEKLGKNFNQWVPRQVILDYTELKNARLFTIQLHFLRNSLNYVGLMIDAFSGGLYSPADYRLSLLQQYENDEQCTKPSHWKSIRTNRHNDIEIGSHSCRDSAFAGAFFPVKSGIKRPDNYVVVGRSRAVKHRQQQCTQSPYCESEEKAKRIWSDHI